MKRLEKKIALVTGAGAGIGEAVCRRFSSEGAAIAAMDLRQDAAERVAADLRKSGAKAQAFGGDISKEADCRRVIEAVIAALGVPHVLCNIAGIVEMGTLLEASEESYNRSMDINVRGMWHMCRLLVPRMLKQGGGSVINMSSVAGPYGVKARGVYSVSKAAVIGLTKSLAKDHVSEGLRVNAICPGTVESPSWHERVKLSPNPEQALKDFIARQPMGRVGQPDEIAALAAYLASDESVYMTGQAIYIDGGMTL